MAEKPEQIDRLFSVSDIKICPDLAHLAAGGGDPLEIVKKYYDRIKKDYDVLMRGVQRIAEGDLDTMITEDIGVFEPFKEQLTQIRTGFKKAVDEEVKSQRMKTEHDHKCVS